MHTELSWKARDGITLYAQEWKPEGEPAAQPAAVVCLVHGIGEHSARYAHVADAFTRAGYALISFDLRGHGRSEGPRGHTPSFEMFMADIDLLLDEARRRYPGIPRFLYGHSLGGLLVLNYALRRKPDLQGVIVTSPGLRTSLTEQKAKIFLSNSLGSVLPTLSISTNLDVTQLSRDPEIARVYTVDPLVHHQATLGIAKETIPAIGWAMAHAAEFSVPLLIMAGTADRIAYSSGSQEFASQVTCECELKLWEGYYHELHNEPDKEIVIQYMIDWLDAHCR